MSFITSEVCFSAGNELNICINNDFPIQVTGPDFGAVHVEILRPVGTYRAVSDPLPVIIENKSLEVTVENAFPIPVRTH